jgi:hypothetical protein
MNEDSSSLSKQSSTKGELPSFVTFNDAVEYAKKWSLLLFFLFSLGIISGGISSYFLRSHMARANIYGSKASAAFLQDTVKINANLAEALEIPFLVEAFSKSFLKKCEEISAKKGLTSEVRTFLKTQLKMRKEDRNTDIETTLLSRYISNIISADLNPNHKIKKGFFGISALSSNTWEIWAKSRDENISKIFVLAIMYSIENVIPLYNDYKVKLQQKWKLDRFLLVKEKLEKEKSTFYSYQHKSEYEISQSELALYRIKSHLELLENSKPITKDLAKTQASGHAEFVNLADKLDTDEILVLSILKNIAMLLEAKAINEKQSLEYIQNTKAIDSSLRSLKSEYLMQSQNFLTLKETFTRMNTEILWPIDRSEFAIPIFKSSDQINNISNIDIDIEPSVSVFNGLIIGGFIGLFAGALLSFFLDFSGIAAISQRRKFLNFTGVS